MKMSTSSPEAVKKLLENMQADLRSLSLECKKKFPPVKEVTLHTHTYIYICIYNTLISRVHLFMCIIYARQLLLTVKGLT